MEVPIKEPTECTSLVDVRYEIDRIDRAIIIRLCERFQYVKEAVKYKTGTKDGITAKERYDSVIKQRGQWAEENGLNAKIIEQVYKILLDYFIEEELKIAKHNK
jgi:isochorismate pyruvate lyase